MSHLSDLMSGNASTLIFSEDIRCTWCLWYRASRRGFTLSQLFKSSVVESTWWLLICFRGDIFIKAISDSLSKGIDSGLATVLWLLVSYSLIVTVRIKGSGARVQFHTTLLSGHLSRWLCRAFANVLIACLRNIVVFMCSWPGVRSRMKDLARDSVVLGCQDRILSSAAYTIQKVRNNRHIILNSNPWCLSVLIRSWDL